MKYGRTASLAVARDVAASAKTALDTLSRVGISDMQFHLRKIEGYIAGLFARSPFQVGDTVELTKTPTITKDESYGWLPSKHFLVAGAIGRVQEIDFDDGKFVAYLTFENESWVDQHTQQVHLVEPDRRGVYSFTEEFVRKI